MPTSTPHRSRVVYYARAADNSDQAHQRLADQAQRARTQLESSPDWTLTQTTTDVGSGTRLQPGLRQLLDRAHAGQFDLLLVERLSDLGRSLGVLTHILNELCAAGVALRTLDGEVIDTTASTGGGVTALLMAPHECQRATAAPRVTKG
jgi:DNA invertase Pin-like site-specific DNA recombinase